MTRDPRVDAYIAGAAPFARPILAELRARVHAALAVDETIKWGMPFFDHAGRPFAFMAAFKAHAGFGLWHGSDVAKGGGMGQLGRLAALSDLPDAPAFAALIAAALARPHAAAPVRGRKPEAVMPDDLHAALDAEPPAAAVFAAFPPGARRDYIEWITDAKQPATRARRLAETIEWVAAGKRRNWKHEAR